MADGMSRVQALRRIILPSSLRRALPAYSNGDYEYTTALASTVTIVEITGAAVILIVLILSHSLLIRQRHFYT